MLCATTAGTGFFNCPAPADLHRLQAEALVAISCRGGRAAGQPLKTGGIGACITVPRVGQLCCPAAGPLQAACPHHYALRCTMLAGS